MEQLHCCTCLYTRSLLPLHRNCLNAQSLTRVQIRIVQCYGEKIRTFSSVCCRLNYNC
uniref:Uncharacterized protein n=1 Tax=Rhizophora mucronata TaxID=61149 RepID=A0A2P2QSX1_RHIMU